MSVSNNIAASNVLGIANAVGIDVLGSGGTSTATLSGTISGGTGRAIFKGTNVSTLVLSGNATGIEEIMVRGGTLIATGSNSLAGTGTSAQQIWNGGTEAFNGSFSYGRNFQFLSATGGTNGTAVTNSTGIIDVLGTNVVTLSGVINATTNGALIKGTGSGTLVLTGLNNTFNRGLTIQGGVVSVSSSSNIGISHCDRESVQRQQPSGHPPRQQLFHQPLRTSVFWGDAGVWRSPASASSSPASRGHWERRNLQATRQRLNTLTLAGFRSDFAI